MDNLRIEIVAEDGMMPVHAKEGDAGADLRANEDVSIRTGNTVLVKTGVRLGLPRGYVGLVCSRSGLALKSSVFVLNAPGVVDSGYRGEVGVILHNAGSSTFVVNKGDRIAQLMIQKFESPEWKMVVDLDVTARGGDGFGSTGIGEL
jgi:dUTP pyrophosphatase